MTPLHDKGGSGATPTIQLEPILHGYSGTVGNYAHVFGMGAARKVRALIS